MKSGTNILFITVDDMNCDSIGCFGCTVDNITPNIDRLASMGAKFPNSHVTIAVCQPSRSVLMTGRYPHHNGARGFEEIDASVTTATETFARYGYYNGIIGKENHLAPREKFAWDEYISVMNEENGYGRDPEAYYQQSKAFFNRAQEADKPFFLMLNVHDPHRPFAGSADEKEKFGKNLPAPRFYCPDEVTVPGFLYDVPDVRREMAQYYSSVHRADLSVGRVLDALMETGRFEDTLILFLSDNGMSAPFSKTNCYYHSTHSPYILCWPGRVSGGTLCKALVSAVDVVPTFYEAAGLPEQLDADGKSFLPAVRTGEEIHEDIYTLFFKTQNNKVTKRARSYPMRCVKTKEYYYIFNAWADGSMEFKTESMSGLTYQAMKKAAEIDPEIHARMEFFLYRTTEEFYDIQKDPDALHNLIDDPAWQEQIHAMRRRMYQYMLETHDPAIEVFHNRVMARNEAQCENG